jgi:2-C-methyl-D-erythritol 2,4-cyclodiphosphate synthase
MKFRVGHGIDVHPFEKGDHVMLGGIKVPHSKGIKAHSDGDVVLHAVTDALLGALGLGDIGQWFPDTDPDIKDIESKDLMLPILMSMRNNGFELNNLDITVICQTPKISGYSDEIRKSIASIFKANEKQINIKATTTENMGSIGREEGIAAHAVISLIGTSTKSLELDEFFEQNSDNSGIHEIDINDLRDEDDAIDLSQEIDIRDFNFDDDIT